MKWLAKWLEARRDRCKIVTEWCGLHIGRNHCATHGYEWDPGEKSCKYLRGKA